MLHIAFLWAGLAFALFGLASLAGFAGLAWTAGQAPLQSHLRPRAQGLQGHDDLWM